MKAVRLLVRQDGTCGLLATNTIAQGDTREVGLDRIVTVGWTILRAVSSRKWPGDAMLEVAHIWIRRGTWYDKCILNERPVAGITPFLTPQEIVQGKLYILKTNEDKSFIGSYVMGTGFILEPTIALSLLKNHPPNKEVLFPYLDARDLNSNFDQSPNRWAINFHNWPLEKAEAYTDCIKIVREKVKPEREKQKDKWGKDVWWQYFRTRPALYAAITGLRRALVIPRHAKYMICCWEPTGLIYSDATCVISTESDAYFASIQSTFHADWARLCGSSLRTDLRYTPSDCFETFPFPKDMRYLNDTGKRYYEHRQSIMLARQEGLTKTYNRFHNPEETAEDIVKLRELHKEMDEAVARAYGWDDLDLGHGFHETKQGLRYTISEEARREVLGRLLKLNHERYAEEVAMGLHEKGGKGAKGVKGKSKQNSQGKQQRQGDAGAEQQNLSLFG